MFNRLLETLEAQGRGIHGYRAVADAAYANVQSETNHSAGFYLIARLAEEFVELNERMPLSYTMLEEMYARLSNATKLLDAAYASNDATAIMQALNEASRSATKLHLE